MARKREREQVADLPCGYVEVGPDDVIRAANPEFLRLVGRTFEEVVGVGTFPQLLAVGDQIYYETHYRPTLEMHHEIREIALELVRPDGEKVPILVSANRASDAAGDAVTRTVVFEARGRRSYELELLRARRAAEDAEARARGLARTLQQTFIPPSAPVVPGLDIAGAYRPAGDGSEIGGDFYEVFQVSSGEWIVAVGDVSGKGVEAAVLTAFVSHTLRALAVQWNHPSEILRALNTALLAHGSDRFCTVVVLRLLRDGDDWLVKISSGGHPLPLLVHADGRIGEIGAAGSLVGVLTHPQLDDERAVISVGDRLVVFTDGVTEARGAAGPFGLERVVALLGRVGRSAAEVTDTLLEGVLEFQDGQARDDIAIVTIAVRPEAEQAVAAAAPGSPQANQEKERALRALPGLEITPPD